MVRRVGAAAARESLSDAMAQASRIQAESINHIMNDACSANAVGPRPGRCGRATAQSLEDMAIVD